MHVIDTSKLYIHVVIHQHSLWSVGTSKKKHNFIQTCQPFDFSMGKVSCFPYKYTSKNVFKMWTLMHYAEDLAGQYYYMY